MSVGAPWSVKGIDPKAREIAKDLARRSNMTLGDWLNQMILEDMTGPESSFGQSGSGQSASGQSSSGQSGFTQSRSDSSRDRYAPPEQGAAREMARVAAALERLTSRMETAESRSTLAISGIDQSVHGLLSRLETAERDQADTAERVGGAVEDVRQEQAALDGRVSSVEGSLEDVRRDHANLGRRVTSVEHATRDQGEDLQRLRGSVEDVRQDHVLLTGQVSSLEAADRDRSASLQRLQGAISEVHTEATALGERLDRVEEDAATPKFVEPLQALENALGKVAANLYDSDSRARETADSLRGDLDHMSERIARLDAAVESAPDDELIEGVVSKIMQRLHDAENRTSKAIQGLEQSFAGLDQRLRNTELRDQAPEQRLEQLAADLARNFDATRAELADKLRTAADTRFDAMERSLREMTDHVGQAERRSAQAIERMGHEVLRMAGNLNSRMEGVESRGARAIEQVSGDVARIADSVEQRFRRADALQAESLEKLGSEISRISERLAERIGNSERRAAQAIDDVGEQVNRVSQRFSDRQDRASTEIADRIRQSEERTARLLDEAREKIDQRLADTQKRLEAAAAAAATPASPPKASEPEAFDLYRDDDLEPGPFTPERYAAPAVSARPEPPPMDPFEDDAFGAFPGDDPTSMDAGAAAHDASQHTAMAEPATAPVAVADVDDDDFGPVAFGHAPNRPAAHAEPVEAAEEARPSSTRELIERARAAARAASGPTPEAGATKPGASTLFSGFTVGRRKKTSNVATALKVSAAFAVVGVTALGYTIMSAESDTAGHNAKRSLGAGEPSAGRVAMALNPTPLTGATPPVVSPSATNAQTQALYLDAVRRIDAKDFTAVADLRKAANLGDPQAQLYLGGLYEHGGAGLAKNLPEARRWTERAAQGGDRKAMHNLASYYFEGVGGARNPTAAVQWFRRAADLGMTDSQYNLAQLYERGVGVGQNPAEAYKWYLIAARAGDADSAKAAERVKGLISADARITAERAALAYRPAAPTAAMASASAPSSAAIVSPPGGTGDLALAQRALSQLGYYRGPQDGVPSPALRMAIQAYQREQRLPQTGAVDPGLAAKFNAIAG